MFQSLSDRLNGVLDKIRGRGALTESDVAEAMREVRRALLEADVALDVVRGFVDAVKAKAVGQEVIRSVKPGQMVVKIVHDELGAVLGSDAEPIVLSAAPPLGILMVGLQGSGKTTTTAKIAYRLTNRDRRKVLMASLDTRRPAAQEQLRVLGEQTGVATLPIVVGQTPVQIAKRAQDAARLGGYDVVIFDTAGRVTVDDELMAEAAEIKRIVNPHEVLLVVDSLTGQDAVNTATAFDGRIGITGTVLTRADGDGRGGAALSMRAVTGKPIKLLGVGEKWDALEEFDPKRVAGRILGMGDIVGLVEKAAETVDFDKAQSIAQKMQKGIFDLESMAAQLVQMQKMGGMGGVMGMMPGVRGMKDQLAAAGMDDRMLRRQHAIIQSMTPKERRHPKLLDGKRKKRIAGGSGTKVEEINRLLKQHRQMADMVKEMGRNPGMMKKMMASMGIGGGMGGLGGMGAAPSAAELATMEAELMKLDSKAIEALPPEVRAQFPRLNAAGGSGRGGTAQTGQGAPGLPGPVGLPGLSGISSRGLPGLSGLPGLGGKLPGLPGKKR